MRIARGNRKHVRLVELLHFLSPIERPFERIELRERLFRATCPSAVAPRTESPQRRRQRSHPEPKRPRRQDPRVGIQILNRALHSVLSARFTAQRACPEPQPP